MNITCTITDGMSIAEKELYFAHMEQNHKYEADKVQQMREETKSYKDMLIEDILHICDRFSEEELRIKSIRSLERIFDNC